MFRFILASLLCAPAWGHDPITTPLTWSKEISRLLGQRCLGCHQPGGPAPFSLVTYREARPWAVAIRDEVSNRAMPPWNAVKGFGSFRAEMALTQEEIQTITDWVNGGAPEGDPALATGHVPTVYHPEPAPASSRQQPAGLFPRAARLLGLQIASLPKDAEAHLYLEYPDGARLPLLWVHDYKPAAPHLYLFTDPLLVPAGARIVTVTQAPQPHFLAVVADPPSAPRRPASVSPPLGPAPAPVGE